MQTKNQQNSLRQNISQLLQPVANTINKLVTLAVLETRLAGLSLLSIIGLTLIGIFLFFAAWLIFLIAGSIWLMSLHIHLLSALLSMMLLNILLLIPVGLLIKHYFRKLLFLATRRQFSASKTQITELLL